MRARLFISILFTIVITQALSTVTYAKGVHAYAMHGTPKYEAGFKHLEYVNPDAPKGGVFRRSSLVKFDSFNPFISKGVEAPYLRALMYDTLTFHSHDEPFTQYGLIAKSMEIPEDRSWVRFHIDPKARFHDGTKVTAEDVVFSFYALVEKGEPLYQFYYADVTKVYAEDELTVKFEFKSGENRELALIIGQVEVMPKHFWEGKDFAKSTLEIPVASGPYKIKSFEAGKQIIYERDPNYWAKDHPVNKGRFNFDEIILDIYLDETVALEAFKAGNLNFRLESTAKQWATQYEGDKFKKGELVKKSLAHSRSTGMQAFVFNTRRDQFKDIKLREALSYAFDYEWSNKNLFYGQYARTLSYFENTELAARGLPSEAELKILTPFKDSLPPELFTQTYTLPTTDGSGKARKNLRKAKKMLTDAGYKIKDGKLISPHTNKPVAFEMIIYQPTFERIILPFKKNLEVLGVDLTIRKIDVAQYIERIRKFDFDMLLGTFRQSLSPGNEQREYWGTAAADKTDSRNIIGIKNKAVDEIIELIINAPSRNDLVTRTRALDRVLLWGHYVIPAWHLANDRVAYSKHLKHPEIIAKYQLDLMAWWYE